MKKTKTFEDEIERLIENGANITTDEVLKQYAIEKINDDNYLVAIHICKALQSSCATYFNYDFSIGTLETPTPLETLEDLKDLED